MSKLKVVVYSVVEVEHGEWDDMTEEARLEHMRRLEKDDELDFMVFDHEVGDGIMTSPEIVEEVRKIGSAFALSEAERRVAAERIGNIFY